MSVLSVTGRAAIRQALVIRPSTLSPVSVHYRCLTLPGPLRANTDLRDINRDPKRKPNIDPHPSVAPKTASTDVTGQSDIDQHQQQKSGEKLWRWVPNVVEKESHAQKQAKPGQGQQPTLHDNDPYKAKREIHPDDAPDAQDLNDRSTKLSGNAEKRSDYEKVRSKIDYANYPAPKRLSSLKEAVHADLKAAKEKYQEVKENMKDLPGTASELEHKIEKKGSQLADKIKSFVKRDTDKKSD